jgi:hypothetical protein
MSTGEYLMTSKKTTSTEVATVENNTAIATPAPVTAAVRQMTFVETAVQQAFEAEMAWRKAKKDAMDAKAAERKTNGMSKVLDAQTAQAKQMADMMTAITALTAALTAKA